MALYQSKQIIALLPVPNPNEAGDETVIISEIVLPVTVSVGDVIEMCGIPDGATVTEVLAFYESADSNGAKTIAFDIGFISGTYAQKLATRTCDASYATADTTAQLGGVNRLSKSSGYFLPTHTDGATPAGNIVVGFGLRVSALAATPVVGARIRFVVRVMPAVYGIT